MLLNWIIVEYFILLYYCYVFSIVFIILFLFSFWIYYSYIHLSSSGWCCVTFDFLSCIYVVAFVIIFITMFPQDLLSQKCMVKNNSSILFFSSRLIHENLFYFVFLWKIYLKFYIPNLMTFIIYPRRHVFGALCFFWSSLLLLRVNLVENGTWVPYIKLPGVLVGIGRQWLPIIY